MGGVVESCMPKASKAEACNGVDDNCDGTIDEGCGCRDGDTHACYTGTAITRDKGICHGGSRTCSGGKYAACNGQVLPSKEQCNGLDDDCDGVVDDQCAADGGNDGGEGED